MQKEKRLFLSHFLYRSAWQSSCTVFSNLVNGVFNGPTIFGRTHFYQKKKAYMLRYWHIRLGHVIAVILVVIVNISRKFSKAKKMFFWGGKSSFHVLSFLECILPIFLSENVNKVFFVFKVHCTYLWKSIFELGVCERKDAPCFLAFVQTISEPRVLQILREDRL